MKKFNKIVFALALTSIGFSSCLKEKNVFEPGNSVSVVEIGDPSPISTFASTSYPYNVYNASFDAGAATSDYSIPIKYSGGVAPQDITVTLALNPTIIDGYNTSISSPGAYLPLPAAYYTVPSYTVTIPKGQSTANFTFSVKPNQFGFTQGWALSFKIASTSVGNVSGNFGSSLFILQAKNAYEANYTVTGYFFHPSSPRGLAATKYIYTLGVNTCEAALGDLGSSNYYFAFNVNGNKLDTWVAMGATPSGTGSGFMSTDNAAPFSAIPIKPGTNGWLSSTYNNSYDASSKTFLMHYGYNGSPGAYTRQAYEKWVRQ